MTIDNGSAGSTVSFDPTSIHRFRFTDRSIGDDGLVNLHYALDDVETFTETFQIPLSPGAVVDREALAPLLDLLHWVAGVSYFKMAAPREVACETGPPPPATAAYLEALYSEGLGEFAYENRARLPHLPRPVFPRAHATDAPLPAVTDPARVLVPIGGGKDSIVALEAVRGSGTDFALFAVNALAPMRRTAEVADVPMLEVRRGLPLDDIRRLNGAGALNGHVPITAIIACVALLTARINGFDAISLANERSASVGNLVHDGIEVNHQFSKSLRAEELLRAAAAEAVPDVQIFSLLRPASELAIARGFAGKLGHYHRAFTSCNRNFHTDPALRGAEAWCRNCPKCRFVFLMLAPFSTPDHLAEVFGGAMLDDEEQYEGFALLTATGGFKPFECVGEEEESLAAIELLAQDERWRDQAVVRRLVTEALDVQGRDPERLGTFLRPADAPQVPPGLADSLGRLLGWRPESPDGRSLPPSPATPTEPEGDELRFPSAPRLTADSDLLETIRAWTEAPALHALIEGFDGTPPAAGLPLDETLAELDAISDCWDYREMARRQRASAGERSHTFDPGLTPEQVRLTEAASVALGLQELEPPALAHYDHVVVLGGLARACLARPLHAAKLLADGTVTTGSVTALGAFRGLYDHERPLVADLVGNVGDTEFDVMRAGTRAAFGLGEPVSRDGEEQDGERLWAFERYEGPGGVPVQVLAAPVPPGKKAPASGGRPLPNTFDACRWLVENDGSFRPGQSVLVVTTYHYRLFQLADALRAWGVPLGLRVDAVGMRPGAIDPRLEWEAKPHDILQETRSAIRALRGLHEELTAPSKPRHQPAG